MDIQAWLLASDPTLRWQVQKDLLHLPPSVWQDTKKQMTEQGFVREILSHQLEDGTWEHGAHFPKDWTGDEQGQPWTATGWSLTQLREWGVDANALRPGTSNLLEDLRWEYEDRPFWDGEVDVCINAYTLNNGVWLARDMSHLIDWFEDHQLEDGGWNCEWVEGAEVSSFHSTLNALLALLEYEQRTGASARIRAMRTRAEDYLLKRHLMRSLSTGELHSPWATHFGYPFRWTYSVIRALDYFRQATVFDDKDADIRLEEAIDLLRRSRHEDGRWIQQHVHPGKSWVEVDAPVGKPSRWLTFYALRILAWWDRQTQKSSAQE